MYVHTSILNAAKCKCKNIVYLVQFLHTIHLFLHLAYVYLYVLFVHLTVTSDGTVTAEKPDGAVSEATLLKILGWKEAGASMDDIIDRLRTQTVPTGYAIHPWIPG